MAFQVSPGINTSEIDLTTGIPAISTTEAGFAGVFSWGPVGKLTLVSSEADLTAKYGRPSDSNYETFFTGANFLAYSNALYVSRAAVTSAFSNTLSANLQGNTTVLIANASTGLSAGLAAYGAGVPDNATISSLSTNATHTIVVLSSNATLGNSSVASTQSVNFHDSDLAFNAVANSSAAVTRSNYIIKNSEHFESVSISSGVEFVAKYPGDLGNSIKVSVCDTADQYSSTINPYALSGFTNTTVIPGNTGISVAVNNTAANVYISNSATLDFATTYTAAGAIKNKFTVGDYVEVGNSSIGTQTLKIKAVGALQNTNPLSPTGQVYFNLEFEQPYSRSVDWTANTVSRKWEYYNVVDSAPSTSPFVDSVNNTAVDQISVVVVDEDGKISGTTQSVLEVYQNLSRATDSKNSDGTTNYYKNVINDGSRYVWAVNDRSGAASANAVSVISSTETVPYTKSFIGGTNGVAEGTDSMQAVAAAYDLFNDSKSVDISLLLTGKSIGAAGGTQLANYLIDNVAEVRKDCVVFVSPDRADVVGTGVSGSQASNVVEFRNSMRSSSYAFLDSGYKRQYDKYNDVFRYVPLNGDIAGLAARTDDVRDPWWSPAGFNRGQIKNIVSLSWNPNQTERDTLYKSDVNPVVSFQGQGTILYGDKTALGRPSAFDRINVRRLFIVLEKTIATAAQSTLFEFNDDFTRAQFKNLVEPFLRNVQGRRGIYDFRVVCDDTNNTSDVIDSNRFVGDIYIKPAKSINFIQLNFVAVRSGVEFTEIVGRF